MKSRTAFVLTGCTVAIALCSSFALAQGKKSTTSLASPTPTASIAVAAKPARPIPYHGKVVSVDIAAKTFTVGKRTFHVTDQTVITDQGKPAKISDIVPVELVSGSYWKKDDKILEAKSVKIGAKTAEEKPSAAENTDAASTPKP